MANPPAEAPRLTPAEVRQLHNDLRFLEQHGITPPPRPKPYTFLARRQYLAAVSRFTDAVVEQVIEREEREEEEWLQIVRNAEF